MSSVLIFFNFLFFMYIFKQTENGISGNLLKLLRHFLCERRPRVLLHGQASTWTNVTAGETQDSILSPLLILISINNLSEVISIKAKLFADDTSWFSVIHDNQTSQNDLNIDLEMIHSWAFKWEMNFNIDPTKQAQEALFSCKTKN